MNKRVTFIPRIKNTFLAARFFEGAFFSVTPFSAAGAFFGGIAFFFGFFSSSSSAPFMSWSSSLAF